MVNHPYIPPGPRRPGPARWNGAGRVRLAPRGGLRRHRLLLADYVWDIYLFSQFHLEPKVPRLSTSGNLDLRGCFQWHLDHLPLRWDLLLRPDARRGNYDWRVWLML